MAVNAVHKGIRMSPRKVGVVAALVRGRSVTDALVILEHTPRRSAKVVAATVKSAAANAENNHSYKPDTLKITTISVTAGPRNKRYRPAARGRANPFQRKTAHLIVSVDGEKRVIKKTSAKNENKETK